MHVNSIRIAYNTAGHPNEFTINLPGYGHDTEYIPRSVDRAVSGRLGAGYCVDNRGSRLEVTSLAFRGDNGAEHLDAIVEAVRFAVGELLDGPVEVVTEVHVTEPAAPKPRACPRCDSEFGSLREVFDHIRAAHQPAAA